MVAADFSGLVGCAPFFGHGEILSASRYLVR
jgi:hypothetical protein